MKNKTNYLLVLICLGIIILGCHIDATYKMEAKVYSINGNEITFEDTTGNLFSCYTEENFSVRKGEEFILKLTNECTESNRTDDKLIGFGKHSFLCFVW